MTAAVLAPGYGGTAEQPLLRKLALRLEAALLGIACPTFIVQGDHDALGPFAVLERIAGQNPRIDLVVVRGAGHDYGSHEAEAIGAAVHWLGSVLRD